VNEFLTEEIEGTKNTEDFIYNVLLKFSVSLFKIKIKKFSVPSVLSFPLFEIKNSYASEPMGSQGFSVTGSCSYASRWAAERYFLSTTT